MQFVFLFFAEGPRWLEGSSSIVSRKILKPILFVVFPPDCYAPPVYTRCLRASRNAVLSLVNNDDNKKNINRSQGPNPLTYLPWTYNAPAYLNAGPAHPSSPALAPCQARNAGGQRPFHPAVPP